MRAFNCISICLLFSWISKAGCETPQIANPPPPDPKDIPLYGPGGQPLESDIQQGPTPDCFLEAPLAAIARVDPHTITGMLRDQGDGIVNVSFYQEAGDRVFMTAKKKDFSHRLWSHDSVSCWVAVLQDTYQKLLDSQGSDEGVYKHGGWAANVFQAIYGHPAAIINCTDISTTAISTTAGNAQSKPMVLETTDSPGELVSSHVYTVHQANESHLTLRNPWGVVNENGAGIPTNGGKDIHNLGGGVFEIPISTVVPQCSQLAYVDLPNAPKRLLRRAARSAQPRPPNVLIPIGVCLGVLVIVATVSAVAFGAWLRRRHREGIKVTARPGRLDCRLDKP